MIVKYCYCPRYFSFFIELEPWKCSYIFDANLYRRMHVYKYFLYDEIFISYLDIQEGRYTTQCFALFHPSNAPLSLDHPVRILFFVSLSEWLLLAHSLHYKRSNHSKNSKHRHPFYSDHIVFRETIFIFKISKM